MTDPREEIKRLADEYAELRWERGNASGKQWDALQEQCEKARSALHAAIDAIPSIRQTMVTCVRCGLLVPESDLMGNLTDAALEGDGR